MADERFVSALDEAEVRDIWDRNADVWIRQVRAGRDHTRADFNNPPSSVLSAIWQAAT